MFGVNLLSTPAAADTPVTVTSSNPQVASVSGAVTIAAGSQVATVTVTTGAQRDGGVDVPRRQSGP